jgi:hypothetical protein
MQITKPEKESEGVSSLAICTFSMIQRTFHLSCRGTKPLNKVQVSYFVVECGGGERGAGARCQLQDLVAPWVSHFTSPPHTFT